MKVAGFTLVELLLVLAVTSILAGVALPAYTGYLQRVRRADATAALLQLQTLQENFRAGNPRYGQLGETGYPGVLSNNGYYRLAVNGTSATGYVASATAVAGLSQANDTTCSRMTLEVSALTPQGSRRPEECW